MKTVLLLLLALCGMDISSSLTFCSLTVRFYFGMQLTPRLCLISLPLQVRSRCVQIGLDPDKDPKWDWLLNALTSRLGVTDPHQPHRHHI